MAVASVIAYSSAGRLATALATAIVLLIASAPAGAAPPIRTSPANKVPACVTPERLIAFLATRNPQLDPKFRDIARWYKHYGEAWRVRWDYAFYQMLVETNYLQFRRPDGKPGDVRPQQNNFAGIGTTGGGVPGDSFPNVAAGVLGQIQHLVVYSGERVADPVAPRTRLKQDDILQASAPIAGTRPLTFQDLSGRWAVDRRYGRTIDGVAELFHERFCNGTSAPVLAKGPTPAMRAGIAPPPATTSGPVPPMPVRAARPVARTETAAAPPVLRCRVQTASFGGRKTLLIRAVAEGEARYTALQVVDGFERSMAETFMQSHAVGGNVIGEFDTRDQALARADELCPTGPAR